jgi:hypothetical protein
LVALKTTVLCAPFLSLTAFTCGLSNSSVF